jgi:hypothetical protein
MAFNTSISASFFSSSCCFDLSSSMCNVKTSARHQFKTHTCHCQFCVLDSTPSSRPWYEKEKLNWSKATSRHLHNTFSTLTGQADYSYIFMVSSAMQFWQKNCSHMSGWAWHALVISVHLKRERLSLHKRKIQDETSTYWLYLQAPE